MNDLAQNKKYQAIFNTSKDLFWKHGIKRVSIEEICRSAEVSKMTFYKYFSNKSDLVKTVFTQFIGEGMKKYDEIVHGDLPFTEKVAALFQLKRDQTKDVSVEFMTDLHSSNEPGLKELLENFGQQSLNIFIDFFSSSQKQGLIRKDIKIEFVLAHMNNMSHLMDDPNLVALYDHPQDLIMESMNFLFYGLSPKQ